MNDEILKRLIKVEHGLKKSVVDRNKQMGKMHAKIQTLATKDDLINATDDIVHKEDFEKMKEGFMPRVDMIAFQETVATKNDLKQLSDSLAEITKIVKNFKIGVHVGGQIFGFSGRFILWVGAFVTALFAINGGFIWLMAKVHAFFFIAH